MIRTIFKFLLSIMFITGGINHFVSTEFYTAMMPAYLPAHELLIYLSGVLEIVFGVGLLISKFQERSAWGIIALLIAVFPANINMYLNADQFPDVTETALLIRLPIQGILIWIAQ